LKKVLLLATGRFCLMMAFRFNGEETAAFTRQFYLTCVENASENDWQILNNLHATKEISESKL